MSLTLTLERGGGEVSGSGTNIELDGTIAGGAIESVEMYGNTEQTTIPGDQLLTKGGIATPTTDTSFWAGFSGSIISSTPQGNGWTTITQTAQSYGNFIPAWDAIQGMATSTTYTLIYELKNVVNGGNTINTCQISNAADPFDSFQVITGASASTAGQVVRLSLATPEAISVIKVTTKSSAIANGIRQFTNSGVPVGCKFDIRVSVLLGDHSSDWQNYVGENWKPYVGGIASPNPDYPQEVQTVTGEQTITISDGNGQSQSYAVDLGSIELCKIGDYQDYIYKSGDDWYIHKEIATKTYTGASGENWSYFQYSGYSIWRSTDVPTGMDTSAITSDSFKSNNFTYWVNDGTSVSVGVTDGHFGFPAAANNINFKYAAVEPTLSDWTTWLANHPTTVYYPLETPTDTQITDSALIAQLEALSSAQTYDGTTVITVGSENLAGPLEVKAATNIYKTYTEVEIGSPFTISDVEGKSSNTTLDGNVYVDWAYNKKQYSFDLFNLTPQDYADIRAFYDYQFSSSAFPTITVPELDINKLPVYMEISSRNIINQCLLTDKLTIKFRETVQP